MLHAALDTSLGFAFAVADGKDLLLSERLDGAGRDCDRQLAPWIQRLLAAHGLALRDIRRWSVGIGPGSFAGLRCGIAFAKGVATATCAQLRGVPSSLAIAHAAALTDDLSAMVLHDGRCGQVIPVRLVRESPGAPDWRLADSPTPCQPDALRATDAQCWCTAQADLLPPLPPTIAERLRGIEKFTAPPLLDAGEALYPWPADAAAAEASTTPLYVRQAVFVRPATLRAAPI